MHDFRYYARTVAARGPQLWIGRTHTLRRALDGSIICSEYRQDVMQKSDLAFSMAVRPCDFDDDEVDVQLPDWDAVR